MTSREENPAQHFALADGSVQFVAYETDYNTYLAMSTRSGAEVVGSH